MILHNAESGIKNPVHSYLLSRISACKSPCKTSASTAVRRLALWGCGIRRLPLCLRMLQHKVSHLPINNSLPLELKKQRSGDFRLSPPANLANSAILPTANISTFFMQDFLPRKPKDSSWSMPPTPQGRLIAREQIVPRPSVSAFRPRHNIIEGFIV